MERSRKTELLQLVERLDGNQVSRDFVGVENQIAELALRHGEVDEAETGRPDLVEDHAAHGGAENLALRVAVDGRAAVVEIGHVDPVVHLERAVRLRVEHFLQAAEKRHADALLRFLAWLDRQVISAKNDIL